jgi:ethanolamine utilization protein EutQ
MKKLITAADVKKSIENGEKYMNIDSNTIITPSARDYASDNKIKFIDKPIKKFNDETTCPEEKSLQQNLKEEDDTINKISQELTGVDRKLIEKIVKEVIAEKMLLKMTNSFQKECDPSGLRLIRGNTVKCEKFDTGNPDANVGLKDIVSTKESPNMGAGFMTIENSSFDWELCYEEFDYIVEGNLDITIDGKTYKGKAGDVFFIPKNSKITWSTKDYAKFFYTTYPANWAELASQK